VKPKFLAVAVYGNPIDAIETDRNELRKFSKQDNLFTYFYADKRELFQISYHNRARIFVNKLSTN